MRVIVYLISVLIFLGACGSEPVYIPKPRLYPKISFPKGKAQVHKLSFCEFNIHYPSYSKIVQDSFYFEERILDKCWFDIVVEDLNARVHCSYIPLKDRAHFDEMVEDAYELVTKHNIKANSRTERSINFTNRSVFGVEYEIDGPVASPLQFYLTDSTEHFLRGSLYFNAKVDPDSIAPVYQFMKKDIQNMIAQFEWK